jgi:putative membrane protein
MKKSSIYLLLAIILIGLSQCRNAGRKDSSETAKTQNENKEVLNEDQSDFLVDAASSGLWDMEMSKLAEEKAQHDRIKRFAKLLRDEHANLNEEIRSLATKKQVTLPGALDADQQEDISELRRLSGREFDRRLMELMEREHEQAIRDFEDASENHKDSDIQVFAAKHLPTLRAHLDSVKMIRAAIR